LSQRKKYVEHTSIRPSNSLGIVPSTHVPFILVSIFSNSCHQSLNTDLTHMIQILLKVGPNY